MFLSKCRGDAARDAQGSYINPLFTKYILPFISVSTSREKRTNFIKVWINFTRKKISMLVRKFQKQIGERSLLALIFYCPER